MSKRAQFNFKPLSRALGLVLSAVLLAACASGGALTQAVDGEEQYQLKRLWRASVGSGGDMIMSFAPDFKDTQVCAASRSAISCFEAAKGKRQWRQKDLERLSAGVSLGQSIVVAGTEDGEIIALNRADGSIVWRQQLAGEILATPVVAETRVGEMVFAQSSDGSFNVLRALDGSVIWVQEQKVPRLTVRGLAKPVVVGDDVLVGYDNGRLVAYRVVDGAVKWGQEVVVPSGRSELERLADVDGPVVVYDDQVFASSWGGRTGSWSLRTGNPNWVVDVGGSVGVAADLRRAYVVDHNNALHSIDSNSGRVMWKTEPLVDKENPTKHAVVALLTVDGAPVAIDDIGRLGVFSRSSGNMVLQHKLAGDYFTPPAVFGELMMTQSRQGDLAVYRLTRE